MATKKYVSLEKLSLYDEKIKAKIAADDATALASAKSYADGLAANYEPAGSSATVQGNLDAEVTRAKGEEARIEGLVSAAQGEIDALELVVDEKASQSDLDSLEKLVGQLPEGTSAVSVVDYVNVKTAGVATDSALEELNGQVSGLQTSVQDIQKDYLKAADKTEVIGLIDTEKERAMGIEGGLESRLAAVEGDYLKSADKTALNDLITANSNAIDAIEADYLKAADKTELTDLVNTEKARAEGVEAGLEDRIETMEVFWEAAQADGTDSNVIDTLKEIQEYIASDETGAAAMSASIKQNSDDIDALEGKMGTVETKLATVAEGAQVNVIEVVKVNGEALSVVDKAVDVTIPTGALASKDKVAEADLESALATKISGKADQTALNDAVEALEAADTELKGRLDAVEAQLGDGENSVSDLIATAKQEAIDQSAADATTKVNQALADAKKYADEEDAKIESRVDALETASKTYALASDVTSLGGKVTTLEGDMTQAKTDIDAVKALAAANDAAIKANAAAIATKANQADLDAVSGRVATLETWHENFIECSEEDVNNLFA